MISIAVRLVTLLAGSLALAAGRGADGNDWFDALLEEKAAAGPYDVADSRERAAAVG